MRLRTLLLPAGATILVAGLFTACGDGPDPDPTPTTAPTQAAAPSPTKGTTVTTSNNTKIGLKAADLPSDMVTTPSGLKYKDQVVGTGATPTMASTVRVHYVGTNATSGVQFDSSVDRGQPIEFPMAGVIAGFSEGLSTMKVGGKRTVLIPAALAYKKPYNPADPTSGDLIFEIELLNVR